MEKEKIFVVDDEPEIVELCSFALQENGYITNTAGNGKQTMETLEKSNYGVVLLDIMLPDINGIDLLAQIKEKYPETDVIMITAAATPQTAVKAMKLGAYDYLIKPLNMDELKLVIKKCFEKRKMVAEISLLKQHKILHETAKMAAISKIIIGLAHELNSPLFGLLAAIRALQKKESVQSDKYPLLNEMKEAVNYCGKIVADLSSFINPSKKEFVLLDCEKVIDKTLDIINFKLKTRNIVIKKKFSHVPNIIGDENQLQNVFLNVIINAQEAMPEGGTLLVATGAVPQSSMIQIEFTDTGCGISPENTISIFDPFFSTKKLGESTGAGLSVAYGIVKNHNGSIEVKSEVNKGATFIIKLPMGEAYG